MKKKVLVYPCGTEIGLEIFRAVNKSIHFELIGGSSGYDHGRFVYKKHIDGFPYIKDNSSLDEVKEFVRVAKQHQIDYIFPAMDAITTVFAKYRTEMDIEVIAPGFETAKITRSKRLTYEVFHDIIKVPRLYQRVEDIDEYPVFAKPDIGQGSVGARRIDNEEEFLVDFKEKQNRIYMEYLPGKEYTVDCFTNRDGKLVFARGRGRKRIKTGISVNTLFEDRDEFQEIAGKINTHLNQRGAWFFQLREDKDGKLTLLEIASRMAGTAAITRNIGINLPLLTLHLFSGQIINSVLMNQYDIELDRAFYNSYKINLVYQYVYVDYDDTVVRDSQVDLETICFLYQCINKKKKIILLTRHDGDIWMDLKRYRLTDIFDEVIHLDRNQEKSDFIVHRNAIFIDDSYNERRKVKEKTNIPVFDTHMLECLLEERIV